MMSYYTVQDSGITVFYSTQYFNMDWICVIAVVFLEFADCPITESTLVQ